MEQKINPDIIAFAEIIDDMYNLYVQKNSNYGNSFSDCYKDYGSIAGLVPLRYKFDRINNLIKGEKNNFESLRDNLIDLANYAIMNVIELDKKLEVPSKAPRKKKILNEGNIGNITYLNSDNVSADINLEEQCDEK